MAYDKEGIPHAIPHRLQKILGLGNYTSVDIRVWKNALWERVQVDRSFSVFFFFSLDS